MHLLLKPLGWIKYGFLKQLKNLTCTFHLSSRIYNTWLHYGYECALGVWSSHLCHLWHHCFESVSTSWYSLLSSAGLLLRGERTVSHVQDKGISKGHRQPLRLWDGKERPFEAQNWHHNSTRSFHNRAGTNNGYLTGPGERYANWDNNVVRPADLEHYYFQRSSYCCWN